MVRVARPRVTRPGGFTSPLRSARLTSHLGLALAVAFALCFATGLLSHLVQHPPSWFWWPSRPVGLYRVSQGVHVVTGLAAVPLLGAKLWSVYPRLFAWPPVRSLAHAVERASIAVLVAASLFQLVSGVLNVSRWYAPMPFFFTAGHYWVAWLAVGAVLCHVGVQLPVIRRALREPSVDRFDVSRRRLLATVGAAAGVITVATAGQTVGWLSGVSVLAPRVPTTGPQGLPVNKTALGAGVSERALDPAYQLIVSAGSRQVALTLDQLHALPQHTAVLPITCVEGWSADATWTGVRLRDLVMLVGGDPANAEVDVESLETHGRYRRSTVAAPHTRDPSTLVALGVNGARLHPDHGYPARLIAPNRPGVLQTKWIARLTIRTSS